MRQRAPHHCLGLPGPDQTHRQAAAVRRHRSLKINDRPQLTLRFR
ncbi:MAG: hypothetical protein SCM88_09235 [Bacillota bacterium]|nr:hypothetical protein [Bacillota bacterium]